MALLDMDSTGDVEFVGCLLAPRSVTVPPSPHPISSGRVNLSCSVAQGILPMNHLGQSAGSATVSCKERSPSMGSQEPDTASAHQAQGLSSLPLSEG